MKFILVNAIVGKEKKVLTFLLKTNHILLTEIFFFIFFFILYLFIFYVFETIF